MTKKDENSIKTQLNWRLSQLPDAQGIAMLVEQGVLDKNEARSILVKEKKVEPELEDSIKIKALKEQIKFLEGIVERLSRPNFNWSWTYTPHYPTYHWVGGGATTTLLNAVGTTYTSATSNNTNYVGPLHITSSQILN